MMNLDCLQKYLSSANLYTELRMQKNTAKRISIFNGNPVSNTSSESGGVSARVYKDGVYGFSSGADYSGEALKSVLAEAEHNALFLGAKQPLCESPLPLVESFSGTDRLPLDIFSRSKAMDFLRQTDEYIQKKYPDAVSRFVSLSILNMEKSVAVTQGCSFHSFVPRCIVAVSLTVMKNGEPFDHYKLFGGYGTFSELFSDPSALYEPIDGLYRDLRAKAEGIYPEAGIKTVILAPEVSGILAHEAVGHTSEGDFVLSGSVAAHNRYKEVASELVTMVDYAHHIGNRICPMPVFVDDEGTPAADVTLINRGILQDYMHSKETARRLGCAPTGNARAFAYSDEPLVRMRNTMILPGKDKLSDMIASVEDGYYLLSTSNGQADSTGEFTFGINFGYEIKKGKLTRPIRNTTISGVAFEMLKTVDMVSDDFLLENFGMCGKKQSIPVAMGGPALRCRVAIGGR